MSSSGPRAHRCWLILCWLISAGCGDQTKSSEPGQALSPPLRVMTFNLLCSFCDSSYAPWEERLLAFQDLFARYEADLIGLQEVAFPAEVEQVLAVAPGMEALWYNEDPERPYPDATILYRSARFRLREQGAYWLSPTPEEPLSSGFASPQLPRLVKWALLDDSSSGRVLYFATTHFDNNSPSQERSAPLLLERTEPWADEYPVLVVGDFNSRPGSPAYELLTRGIGDAGFSLTNSFDLVEAPELRSNQTPEPGYEEADRIDHLFVAGAGVEWQSSSWTVDLFQYGEPARYPSDHRAMVAELRYR